MGLAVLETIAQESERLCPRDGDRLATGLRYQEKHEIIGDLRGFGLLQGVELVKDRETRTPDVANGRAITQRCMELGLSMNIVSIGAMAAIWRIAPPLTVSPQEIDRGIAIIDEAIDDVLGRRKSKARNA
jgi:2,2-dialkylglycine decarboxylase (pyruvate)